MNCSSKARGIIVNYQTRLLDAFQTSYCEVSTGALPFIIFCFCIYYTNALYGTIYIIWINAAPSEYAGISTYYYT